MSEIDKDNKEFEFIKEQVIEKRSKKIKKWLLPLLMTFSLAILFGIIAAITFVITEPRLYRFLHKEEEIKTPITFPTEYPDENPLNISPTPAPSTGEDTDPAEEGDDRPDTVIVERTIDADIEDFTNMFLEVKEVAHEANKSLVNVTSIIRERDWFGNMVERTVKTTGLVVANNSVELLVLVSRDRVKDANSIKLEFTDTVSVDAVLQDYESELNLAVIAVPLESIPAIFLSNITMAKLGESYTVTTGSPIIALGSPNGHPGSMEVGIVTSRGSWVSVTDNKLDLFNTSIEDNKNSDGIILNLKGEVVGLITRDLKEGINTELSTAVGISRIRPILLNMCNKTPRIYFGIVAEDMTEAAKIGHEISNGIYINEVQASSPAFDAGIKNGDIILQVEGNSILNTNNFYNIISGYKPEDEINVTLKRTSGTTETEMTITVTLEEKEQ